METYINEKLMAIDGEQLEHLMAFNGGKNYELGRKGTIFFLIVQIYRNRIKVKFLHN